MAALEAQSILDLVVIPTYANRNLEAGHPSHFYEVKLRVRVTGAHEGQIIDHKLLGKSICMFALYPDEKRDEMCSENLEVVHMDLRGLIKLEDQHRVLWPIKNEIGAPPDTIFKPNLKS